MAKRTNPIARMNGLLGGRPKGKKDWTTVEKEKAREHYQNELAKHFDRLIHIQFDEALKPYNVKERMYVIDQMMGKPKESMEVEQVVNLKIDV